MKIVSCDHCGVLLDAEKLFFPKVEYHNGEVWNKNQCEWHEGRNEYVSKAECPVCKTRGVLDE